MSVTAKTPDAPAGRGLRFFPDCIGIGAQKAGTTWLFENLDRHPEIWMAPIKEVLARPEELLNSVFDFLGVSRVELPRQEIEAVVNPSIRAEIPSALKRHLQAEYRHEIEQLSERVGGRAIDWLRELDADE